MRRILVISVDVDDDFGRVGIKTPILGRDNVIQAAVEFGIRKPEDSDLNAAFAAVQIADSLKSKTMDTEVAIVTGSPKGGVEADMEVRRQVQEVLKQYPADGIVIVTDGPEDEKIIPIIQDLAPIISTRRVIVEQSKNLEQTYMLFSKMIRKAIEEERFSKYTLGIPGLMILVFSLLSLSGLVAYTIPILSTLLGLFMVIKGFGIDEAVSNWWKSNPISLAATLISATSFLIALVLAYLTVNQYGGINVRSVSALITNALPYFSISVAVLIIAKMVDKIKEKDVTLWRDAVVLASLAAATVVLVKVGSILASLPPNVSYGEMARRILESDVPRTLVYAVLSVIGLAGAMVLMERWVIEREEDEQRRPEQA
ncbi:hypothetical protein IPA_00695 [Ignicoccus pacificus DSM 13166]|uniref:DUF373 family protein n=1 Tax=Ignicoccus pacificus DSM 13166 TaxID=940294 RepID=A0A977KAD3_9CREN|nr:hypothetical protein IPA_00695 [Ignicoccus pacificus DSM 13166]